MTALLGRFGKFLLVVNIAGIASCHSPTHPLLLGTLSEAVAHPTTLAQSKPPAARREIKVQGKLEPKGGILRLSGLPGDKVDAIHARPGQRVEKGKPLATFRSSTAKQLELDIARLKLAEAQATLEAKHRELDLAVQIANDRVKGAVEISAIATSQVDIAKQGAKQVERMREQLESLRRLARDPITKGAIGRLEIQAKEIEIESIEAKNRQAVMTAENAVKQAELQQRQAEQGLQAAEKTRDMANTASPIPALAKQVELLELQLSESYMVAPTDVTVLNVITEEGERAASMPIMEVADLSQMVCIAEVYEADVARIQRGDNALIKSPALREEIKGTVSRIDLVVGSPQMRSPDPLARTDFRAVRVWIDIHQSQAAIAAERLRLQVDVMISPSK